jgi:phage terminase large subunit-like protein
VASVLQTVDPTIPLKLVHASRGKIVRAEPISASYEQARFTMFAVLDRLEHKLCFWVPGM